MLEWGKGQKEEIKRIIINLHDQNSPLHMRQVRKSVWSRKNKVKDTGISDIYGARGRSTFGI